MKILYTIALLICCSMALPAQEEAKTTFNFGGYVKADFINTWYQNGEVGAESPLRDFHLPGQIPVGPTNRNFGLDYHVKESRFNFDVKTTLLGEEIHGFLEMDFLLSAAGNERVSNSFNPRLRHFYFEWDRLLIGQTWMTFMIVVVPDELDFTGALDGLVAGRQPMIRYKAGDWWFAIENPETTFTSFEGSDIISSESEVLPDLVARRNFSGNWGTWAVAGMVRTLRAKAGEERKTTTGFGITTGGKLKIGKNGDDVRIMLTAGQGLGRYLAANFISSAVQDQAGDLNAIGSVNGYIAYNHYWMPEKLSSSFSVAAFQAFHKDELVSNAINNSSYSVSGNLKYDPVKKLRFGVEYMYAFRGLKGEDQGSFHRIQFSAKYLFGYFNVAANEKS